MIEGNASEKLIQDDFFLKRKSSTGRAVRGLGNIRASDIVPEAGTDARGKSWQRSNTTNPAAICA